MIDEAVILTPAEVAALAGGYTQPARQLRALHALGFWRARIGKVSGEVVLERAHYDAVSASAIAAAGAHQSRPKVRPVHRSVR